MTQGALVVLAKLPRAGRVKTRLAPRLGIQGAAAFQSAVLRDMLEHAWPVAHRVLLFDEEDVSWWARATALGWRVGLQSDGGLGERMAHGLRTGQALARDTLLIGSDAPLLTGAVVAEALALLRVADAVLIPALDGGFAGIGGALPWEEVWRDLRWSHPGVAAEVRAALSRRGWCLEETAGVMDVDTPDDLDSLLRSLVPDRLGGFASRGRHLNAWLRAQGAA